MTLYSYRAVAATGRMHSGQMEADNEQALGRILTAKGLELIELRTKTKRPALWPANKIPLADKQTFCAQMQTLLSSGLTLENAIQTIEGSLPQGPLKDFLVTLREDLLSGQSLRNAFERHSDFAEPVFLALLATGEATGNLSRSFGHLAAYIGRSAALRRTFVRAVRYPLFLFSLAFGVTCFMMVFVVPEIVGFLTNNGGALPFATRLLITLAKGFEWLWWLVPTLGIAFSLAFLTLRRLDSAFASASDEQLLRLPVVGSLIRKQALARLTCSLGLLLQSGHTLPQAIETSRETLGNRALSKQLSQAHTELLQGASFSKATENLLPDFYRQMIAVAESGGNLPDVLATIARHSDVEAHDAVQSFLGALEPALTLFVGGLLAWVVLAVLGPVYGALGTLSAGGTL